MAWDVGSSLRWIRPPVAPTFEGSHELDGGPMHTHDLENHDNLYADEGTMVIGETRADAQSHAYWAVGAIALMVVGLGVALVIS
jgi:hypothetical protein